MPETNALMMVRMEANPRNQALLTLTYGTGLRNSEVCNLRWRDMAERDGGAGQATVYGKGGKTRVVLLSTNTWKTVAMMQGDAGPDGVVFQSRKTHNGRQLDRRQVHLIVKAAAARAGLSADVSAHWLRHAHASHSLDKGARSISCRRRSGMPAWRRPGGICMPGLRIAQRGIWVSERSLGPGKG